MAALVATGIPSHYSTAIGNVIGAYCNYLLQRNYTFENSSPYRETLLKYLASCATAWLLNLAFFVLIQQITPFGVPLTQFITSFLVALFNYHFYKRFVFHARTQS
ncbi:GtrA family protein [Pseudohongiella nitratireducens]|uniref:GtrA family protein n=1 Tax=Pseudohongiella nitratireducens TaxID=1768907 RepID=UPI003C6E7730